MSGLIVHEWLEATGGAENVVEEMVSAFPDAGLLALWDDSLGRFGNVRESILSRTPLRRNKALSLPLMPTVWRTINAGQPDWLLVSSHLFAHHVRLMGAPEIPKFVYAHTPARYIWVPELDGRGAGPVARVASAMLKPLDRRRAQEATAIAANSHFIADRVAKSWGRESVVIYPPVDTDKFGLEPVLDARDEELVASIPAGFVFAVSRWVPYKRLDMAIRVGELTGRTVVLAGRGPDADRLRNIAAGSSADVRFVESPSDDVVRALHRRAALVVFAPVEDFGIVPVEAMAAGTPVLVNAIGGASESVVDGKTGAHVHRWESDVEVADAAARALNASASECVQRARHFSQDVFRERIRKFVVPA